MRPAHEAQELAAAIERCLASPDESIRKDALILWLMHKLADSQVCLNRIRSILRTGP